MTYRLANVDDRAALVVGDHWFDVDRLSGGALGPDPMAVLARPDELRDLVAGLDSAPPDGRVADVALGPPVPRPRSCFAVGLNYPEHAAETAFEVPEAPLVFTKFPGCLTGPDADVELRSEFADYEAELVAVIGRTARDVEPGDAWGHIAGLTVGNDLSDRALQFAAKPPHFDLGKSRDGYGPIGPVVVAPDGLTDPTDLAITCAVNGETRQADRTSSMIFDIPHLVSYLSRILTLHPGDLIFTGTPEGIGAKQRIFLEPGDVVTTSIEGIGTITTRCR